MKLGICPMCSKEETWSHILRCAGTKISRDEVADRRCRNMNAEIGVRRITGHKNEE
jgi:hypothetical protein